MKAISRKRIAHEGKLGVFTETEGGINVRTHLASMAMQGMMANPDILWDMKRFSDAVALDIARKARRIADAMIVALLEDRNDE